MLVLLNVIWGIIEYQTGLQFLWIVFSILLIDIVWRAKKQMDNEERTHRLELLE